MSTGAYLRAKRDGEWKPVEVERLTVEERKALLGDRKPEELLRWLDVVCESLTRNDALLAELEAEGIITRAES